MSYEQAQDLIGDGEVRLSRGDVDGARRSFGQAARIYRAFVETLPLAKRKTRSLYGFDAAYLFFRAGELADAERTAHWVLAEDSIDEYPRRELQDLLARIWDERSLQEIGLRVSRSPWSVVLRGHEVLGGFAPSDIVDLASRTVWNYIRRMVDFLSGQPFANRPSSPVAGRYRALQTPAIQSSYRIDIYLGEMQGQLPLEDGLKLAPEPDRVIDYCESFAVSAAREEAGHLAELVPSPEYRGVMLRLVRNLVPNGTAVTEVELRRTGAPMETAVTLMHEHRPPINRLISQANPHKGGSGGAGDTYDLVGILRMVDLDAGKVRLEVGGGGTTLHMGGESEDSIGAFVNRRVRVTVSATSKRGLPGINDIDFAAAGDQDGKTVRDDLAPPPAQPRLPGIRLPE